MNVVSLGSLSPETPLPEQGGRYTAALSSLAPRPNEIRLAIAVVALSSLVFVGVVPFARLQWPRIDLFIPIYEAALIVSDLVTAALLFGQVGITRSRSVLVLASGYVFTAAVAAVHLLSFPGAFSAAGLLGAGPQTTAWLYMVWHGGFPLAVIGYGALKARPDSIGAIRGRPVTMIASSLAVVALLVAAVALLSTAGQHVLPSIMQGNGYTPLMIGVVSAVWSLSLVALVLLWFRRPHSVLDLWLMVVMCAWLFDVALSAVLNAGRFDVGFYVGRMYGLLAANFILFVLLSETANLHALACGMLDRRTADLARANAKLQALIDSSPLATVALDLNCRVVTWGRSAERIFGYPASEVIGRPYPLVPERGWDDFKRQFDRVVIGLEQVSDISVQRQRKDGRVLDVVFSGAPLYDEDRHVIGAVYTLEDVTDRKKVERKLVQTQKMEAVGQLTGGIAHDFNNILGLIIGNLDQLLETGHDAAAVTKYGTAAVNAALQASQLIRRLLAFARNQPLEPKLLELSTVARGMEPLLRGTLGERITIETWFEEDVWPVLADPGQFENAILNLAINARDAMPNGGRLVLSCKNVTLDETAAAASDLPVGDFVALTVSDTGTGIPADLLARVFEPFFTTKEIGKGSGLGLSMVYGYAKQSGGSVKIYSEVGRGTDVRLYLPRARAATAADPKTGAKAAPLPKGTETILVVEDKGDMRQLVVSLLQSLGYRVIEAANAATAVELLGRGASIDLLFTDVVMPGPLSGADLAREARRMRPDLPIVLTTGFSDPETVRAIVEAVGATTVTKPYRKADLAQHLRLVLDRCPESNGIVS